MFLMYLFSFYLNLSTTPKDATHTRLGSRLSNVIYVSGT